MICKLLAFLKIHFSVRKLKLSVRRRYGSGCCGVGPGWFIVGSNSRRCFAMLPARYRSRRPAASGVCPEFEAQGAKPDIET